VFSCADPQRLQQICDDLSAEKIDRMLRKWLHFLPHPFTAADQKAGFRYDISILQAEFSLTQVLDRPVHGRLFFEQVIRENLDLGRPDEVQLIFDRRITRRTPGRMRTSHPYPGRHPFCPRLLQEHPDQAVSQGAARSAHRNDDQQRLDFAIGKRLHNLPKLREIGFRANRRLLEVERLSYDCILAEATFQQINGPVERAGQRASGLRLADPRIHALWHAFILFRLLPKGFRRAELRDHLADLIGRHPETLGRVP
jgi:hypothetical protein